MHVVKLLNWTQVFLTFMALTIVTAQYRTNRTGREKSCDQLRREMTELLRGVYDRKNPPEFFKHILPNWIELTLPVQCGKRSKTRSGFVASTNENGGPLGSLRRSRINSAISGNARQKRASSRKTLEHADTLLRDRRSVNNGQLANNRDNEASLYRRKRFLGLSSLGGSFSTMSLGNLSPTPVKEVSESAQMMNNLLLFSKLQKQSLAREYSRMGREGNSYVGDRVSFGTGMYGDTYPGKRKREAVSREVSGYRPSASPEAKSRRKRFLFGGDPAEGPAGPSLFSILMGTATDPNTGKKIEFGGDYMKRSMANTFMAFLPPGLQPTGGKEPGDALKRVAPLWLFSNFGSSGNNQRRNRNGLFGDGFLGKKRRRRALETSGGNKAEVSHFFASQKKGPL